VRLGDPNDFQLTGDTGFRSDESGGRRRLPNPSVRNHLPGNMALDCNENGAYTPFNEAWDKTDERKSQIIGQRV